MYGATVGECVDRHQLTSQSDQASRHQLLRRVFETANSSLTRLLRIRKGTLTSRYFQLYNAFFVSAVIHHVGSLNCPFSAMVWYQFYFFMIQPVAIMVEDFAIYLGKKADLRDNCKASSLTLKHETIKLTRNRED